MAEASTTFKTQKSYFHNFSRVAVHSTQQVYESTFRNGHRVLAKDVWVETIGFCPTESSADDFTSSHPGIVRKHTAAELTEVAGSNGQMYRVVTDGTWISDWIAPTDSLNSMGETSQGFACKLLQNNGVTISLTEGVHIRNYFNGIIEFQVGYTPSDLGYQLPLKVTFYEYIGKTLADIDFGGGSGALVEYKDRFVVSDPSKLTYDLTKVPNVDSEKVFVQGIFLDRDDDYEIVDNSITFVDGVLELGKKIVVTYTNGSNSINQAELETLIENIIGNSLPLRWIDYVLKGTYVSTEAVTGGDRLTYNFSGGVIYRFIPTEYTTTEDAFYSDLDMTILLARRD